MEVDNASPKCPRSFAIHVPCPPLPVPVPVSDLAPPAAAAPSGAAFPGAVFLGSASGAGAGAHERRRGRGLQTRGEHASAPFPPPPPQPLYTHTPVPHPTSTRPPPHPPADSCLDSHSQRGTALRYPPCHHLRLLGTGIKAVARRPRQWPQAQRRAALAARQVRQSSAVGVG